ncbi:MAG TPA: c-type cytochrome [Candidatus Binatia bacterium]|jgi:mono/diheme cytochrome c family protein|nr:c-type cytochrome [Candidatus Binatia bacterium]
MRIGRSLVLFCVLALFAGALWFYWHLTAHGFSARVKPSALEAFLAEKARALATPSGAKALKNPLDPTALNVAEARDHFADHCAICHANTGSGKTLINSGLYPPAPDLREQKTQKLSDGETFFIIKNGIRFTGMPGWGGSDEENWKLVLFIRHLPHLSSQELASMQEVNGLQEEDREGEAHAENTHTH